MTALEPLYQGNIIPKDTMVIVENFPIDWLEDIPQATWPEAASSRDAVSPWVWAEASADASEPVKLHILRADLRMAADLWALKEGKPFSQINKPFMAYECFWKSIAAYMRLNDTTGVPFEKWNEQANCLAEPLREPFHYIMTVSPGPGIAPFSGDVLNTMGHCFDQMEGFYVSLLSELVPAAINQALDPEKVSDDWWAKPADNIRKNYGGKLPSCGQE